MIDPISFFWEHASSYRKAVSLSSFWTALVLAMFVAAIIRDVARTFRTSRPGWPLALAAFLACVAQVFAEASWGWATYVFVHDPTLDVVIWRLALAATATLALAMFAQRRARAGLFSVVWAWWRDRPPVTGWAASPGPSVTLAALSQAMPMMFVDERGVIRNATASMERLAGYSLDELLGRPLLDLVPERDRAAHLVGFARYLKMGSGPLIGRDTAIDVYVLRKDGTEVSAALVVTTIVEDGQRWFIGGFMRRADTVSVNEERTIVAAERQADASERLAAQGDVLHNEDVAGRSATAQERIANASDALAGNETKTDPVTEDQR